MSARLLDGRSLSLALRRDLRARVDALSGRGITPRLGVLIVGHEDPSSLSYVQTIAKVGAQIGVEVTVETAPGDATTGDIAQTLKRLSADPTIHGLMLQQPLPTHLSAASLVECILPEKDVDGANPITQGHLAVGRTALFTPATPRAVMELLQRSSAWPVTGKHAVVIGKSSVVGMPVALLLLHAGATVTVTHKDTTNLAGHLRQADILVSAAGVPNLVTGDMLKTGVVIIDVGTTVVGDQLVGDVNAAGAQDLAAEYTPVPGGVGPVTTAMLLTNVVDAAERM